MADQNFEEKTEQATPKKRQDARKKGMVAQSREIPSVMVLTGGICVLGAMGSWIICSLSSFMNSYFQGLALRTLNEDTIIEFFAQGLRQTGAILLPMMLVVLIAGIAGNILQIGFMFNTQSLSPKAAKLNPIKGMKKLFSIKSLVELIKSSFKIIIVGGVAYLMIRGDLETIPGMMLTDVNNILVFIGVASLKICLYTCLALIIVAALDYAFQKWEHEKNIKMSKHEIKEETKQREGDPIVKAKIKNIQREMSQRRMMESVPDADFIVTNPTTLAIALKYDQENMAAPKVIAKGAGLIAEKIKEIARNNDIPIIENKPVAQSIYKMVDIDDVIPAALYRAVAEILAYVYRLKSGLNNA